MICAFAVGLSILFFRFFVSARGHYTFFLFYYHRPWAKLLLVIFFAIARGRK